MANNRIRINTDTINKLLKIDTDINNAINILLDERDERDERDNQANLLTHLGNLLTHLGNQEVRNKQN